jgi:hypothetical protein
MLQDVCAENNVACTVRTASPLKCRLSYELLAYKIFINSTKTDTGTAMKTSQFEMHRLEPKITPKITRGTIDDAASFRDANLGTTNSTLTQIIRYPKPDKT